MVDIQSGWRAKSRRLKRIWSFLFAMLALGVMFTVLRSISWSAIWEVISGLAAWQLVIYLIVNVLIFSLFGWRWQIILRALGYPIEYWRVTQYRLASYGVSYFTPGPHFGGEPLQVYYLVKRHNMPTSMALASITLDKLFELCANFSFIVLGFSLVVSNGVFGDFQLPQIFPLALILFLTPVSYLGLIWWRKMPFTKLLSVVWSRGENHKVFQGIKKAEQEMSDFCRQKPKAMFAAIAISVVVWGALFFEFGMSLWFLGARLNMLEVIAVLTVARVALLITPLPGALGSMELGLSTALGVLSFGPAYGAGFALLIRARDVLFGLIGLGWHSIASPKN